MKKQIIALSLGLMTIGAFAQKNELKAAEKAIKKQDYSTAVASVTSVDAMVGSMDAKYKVKYYFLKGQAFAGKKDYKVAAKAFNDLMAYEKQIRKTKYTDKALPMLNNMITEVSTKAIKLYNDDQDYKNAAENFYLTYLLSPKDTSFMFNAAVSASLAKEYATSLKYYKILKDIGYTGVTNQYLATNKESGVQENLGSKKQRDLMVKVGQYTNPEDKSSESKRSEIVKNIGYLLIQQGKTDEAIVAMKEARAANPKDLNLLLTEADLYIKLNKMDKFGELMQEAVKMDPTNPTLFFNLGVVNAGQKKTKEAQEYYRKAIELNPEYGDAYMNLAISILSEEKSIIDEMNNNLSNFKKYDELEQKQKDLYKKALPFLEKADTINRSIDTVKSLLNIYDVLEIEEKANELRAVYKKMKG